MKALIEYRRFRNSDPPQIVRLWQTAGLGRGAAIGLSADHFDDLVFAQPYFDRNGLILACEGAEAIGFVHAGFGTDTTEQQLCRNDGVICAVVVDPRFRRQGIGRKLVELAERYLNEAGATAIRAGAAHPCDPFYFGLYGGCEPAGFLESDAAAAPFFQKLGYVPTARHLVFQRKLNEGGDPIGLRLMSIRRSTSLVVVQPEEKRPWWWQTRTGRLDTVDMALVPKAGGATLARVTMIGLDLYIPRWQTRPIGLTDLWVMESLRGKGYGQALIVEVCRRVRNEMIGLAEAHAAESDTGAIGVLKSSGFQQVDAGVVYRKA